MRKDGLLTVFNSLRVTSFHIKQVKHRFRFLLPVADLFDMSSGSTIVIGHKNKGLPDKSSVAEVPATDVIRYMETRDGTLTKNLMRMQ